MSDYPIEQTTDKTFCSSCGAMIRKKAEVCPKCGARQQAAANNKMNISSNWLTLLLLSIFLGSLGVDRFYAGKIGTGILKLITAGGCGIWWLIDIIMIVCEKFTDSNGNIISRNA